MPCQVVIMPVGAAPTTSSLSTMDCAKTTARWDKKNLGDLVSYIRGLRVCKIKGSNQYHGCWWPGGRISATMVCVPVIPNYYVFSNRRFSKFIKKIRENRSNFLQGSCGLLIVQNLGDFLHGLTVNDLTSCKGIVQVFIHQVNSTKNSRKEL